MSEEKVFLVLGCFGRKEDSFELCPGVENRIIKLDDSLLYIDDIWSYLEAVKLLDKPVIDINAIRNIIFRMQDKYDQKIRKLWSEKEFHMIERFINMHKQCGLYMKLVTAVDELPNPKEFELIKVQGSTVEKAIEPNMTQVNRSRR